MLKGDPVRPATPYYVKGLALGLSAFLIAIHLWTWVFTLPVFLHGRADFRQLYTAGYLVRSGRGHQLYDYDTQFHFQNELVSEAEIALPFIRPAYQALLFAPLSFLPYRTAYLAFLAVNLALLWVSFRSLRPKMNRIAHVYPWLPAATFLGFLPVTAALIQGQDSILLLTLLAAALVSLERNRELTAGVFLGLGLFKFQIVIPIALLFLAWKRWRFSAGFAIAGLGLGTISVWLVGFSQAGIYVRSLVAMGAGSASRLDQLRYPISMNVMPNLHGLIFGVADCRFSASWIAAATIILSGVVGLLVATRPPVNKSGGDSLLLAITAATVVSYYLFIHDLSVLLVPISVTLDRFIETEATGDKLGRRMARTSALLFVAPVCMSYSPRHFYVVSLPILAFLGLLLVQRSNYPSLSSD
jgi:Glycosyltransferase family 87